jgi:pyroglutamyl-peptidase
VIKGRNPKLLVTGFGPFPGAPENPTEALVRALADEAPQAFGAGALRAAVIPTDYRRSWRMLLRLYQGFRPDVVVHFGLAQKINAIHVERIGQNAVSPEKPDAAGNALRSGRARRTGPEVLHSTLPVSAIVAALTEAGFPAALSDDAGDYVCNATLYRSLHAAPTTRRVGFIHVPPESKAGVTHSLLVEAGRVVLRASIAEARS